MTVIDESLTAKGFTPANQVPFVFGGPRVLEGITIHWWGSYGQTHDGVCAFFCTTGPGATSAHFVASGYPTKRINCIVSPEDAAWHAGNAVGNRITVGIECRPEATDADYEVVAEVVRFLWDTYGEVPLSTLYPHKYWNATSCPGNYDLNRIASMARALKVNPTPTPIQPKPPTGEIVDIKYDRDVITPATPIQLGAGVEWVLKNPDLKTNWNLADEGMGLGYYDADIFIQGTDLFDGETLDVQVYVVTGAELNKSGYFSQQIEGATDGTFKSSIRFKSPLLSTASLWVSVKATNNAKLTVWGSDIYKFEK